MHTTTLSSKGQVVIPMDLRKLLNWEEGMKLQVTCRNKNIALKPVAAVKKTLNVRDVAGCMAYSGKPKTIEEMDEAITLGAKYHDCG